MRSPAGVGSVTASVLRSSGTMSGFSIRIMIRNFEPGMALGLLVDADASHVVRCETETIAPFSATVMVTATVPLALPLSRFTQIFTSPSASSPSSVQNDQSHFTSKLPV